MTAQSFLRRTSGSTANQEFSGVSNYRNEQIVAQNLRKLGRINAVEPAYQPRARILNSDFSRADLPASFDLAVG